ncbi:MAG: hypothetical protein MK081_14500 [Flavobacteriales bacterium]|nr:hypothetical protein [Flavobacteriales bacterium]
METLLLTLIFSLILVSPEPELALEGETVVTFTLRNESARSIPLIIPGVMKPNLLPISNSGVHLKVGQEIFFRHKGKKRLLLTVDESLEGKTLKVAKLIKEKKKKLE